MPRKPPPLVIPRGALEEGVKRCLRKAEALNEDAARLLRASDDSLTHASVLFSYAVEELGKAALLADLMHGTQDPVTVDGFFDHSTKLERAESLLGGEVMLREGVFQRNAFQRGAFDVGVSASDLYDRPELLFVDWHGGRWRLEPTTDAARLEAGIGSVRSAIGKLGMAALALERKHRSGLGMFGTVLDVIDADGLTEARP